MILDLKTLPYDELNCSLRNWVLPSGEKQLKKLRTKRRRIRSHFQGLENIQRVSVCLICVGYKQGRLIGFRIRVTSSGAFKGLDASENYIYEPGYNESSELAAIAHCMVTLLRLMLNTVAVEIYCDEPLNYTDAHLSQFFDLIKPAFNSLEFKTLGQGTHKDWMMAKLNQLKSSKTNEIVTGDLSKIVDNCLDKLSTCQTGSPLVTYL